VFFDVCLGSLSAMVRGMVQVSVGGMRMVGRFVMLPSRMMLGRFVVMLGRMFVMLGRFAVMVRCFLGHESFLHGCVTRIA
jgi:hypothetical protein